jgi:hypothetical protein
MNQEKADSSLGCCTYSLAISMDITLGYLDLVAYTTRLNLIYLLCKRKYAFRLLVNVPPLENRKLI